MTEVRMTAGEMIIEARRLLEERELAEAELEIWGEELGNDASAELNFIIFSATKKLAKLENEDTVRNPFRSYSVKQIIEEWKGSARRRMLRDKKEWSEGRR